MFKKPDYILISIIGLFLGIFLVSQYYSTSNYKKVTQPQNNEVLAIEVAKLTKTNADLRSEIKKLTADLETYKSSSDSKKELYDKYLSDSQQLDIINGFSGKSGQGVVIQIEGGMTTAQIVDLINAVKNIGSELMMINGERVTLQSSFYKYSGMKSYEIKVLGNSRLLKSAIERKGGIMEQINGKDLKFSVFESDNIDIVPGKNASFKYGKVIVN